MGYEPQKKTQEQLDKEKIIQEIDPIIDDSFMNEKNSLGVK